MSRTSDDDKKPVDHQAIRERKNELKEKKPKSWQTPIFKKDRSSLISFVTHNVNKHNESYHLRLTCSY
jgi:uncharacterized protein YdhG (YjbR/CyaY superfamily)